MAATQVERHRRQRLRGGYAQTAAPAGRLRSCWSSSRPKACPVRSASAVSCEKRCQDRRCASASRLGSRLPEGDIRGIYGNQYATTYVGAITELLVKAGYADDPRIARILDWLLATRQNDGGWAIPMRTLGHRYRDFLDVMRHPAPLSPDRSRPSSHLVTGMVLRAFAANPAWRQAEEVRHARELLASRLFKRDCYGDRGDASCWERVSFPFWFTDIVSALDTLSRLGFSARSTPIAAALGRLSELQHDDETFALKLLRAKDKDLPWWICLAVHRSLRRWQGQ
jgi:hypothetical protein